MKTLFGVRNTTGEVWPAYGMGRLGAVITRDGRNADLPLYTLIKPDGVDGIYVVNGASPLADDGEGTAIYYLDAQRVAVDSGMIVELNDLIGAVYGQWEAGDGCPQFRVVDEKNTNNIAPVLPIEAGVRLQGILQEDLYAAVNTKRDPSTAIVRLLKRKTNGDLKLTTKEKTVVNRFKNISIDSGSYIKFEWQDGEWQPCAADCPGGSSSSGSESV